MDNKRLLIIFFVGFLLRIVSLFIYRDLTLENEWGVLVQNLIAGNGYTYWSVTNEGALTNHFVQDAKIYIPSAYMPPLYAFFIFCFAKTLGVTSILVLIVQIAQVLLSLLCVVLVYKITLLIFDKQAALIGSAIVSIYPALIFMVGQISSINIYLPLTLLLIYFLLLWQKTVYKKQLIYSGILSGLIMLTRGEFFLYLFPIITWIFYLSNKKVRYINLFHFILPIFIIVAPYSFRNQILIGQFFPTTTAGGLNLFEGNNLNATGIRSNYNLEQFEISASMVREISALEITNHFESDLDSIYKKEALHFIVNNPISVIKLFIKKFAIFWTSFIIVESKYPHVNNPLFWVPWLIHVWFFILAILKGDISNSNSTLVFSFIFTSSFISCIFFVLPRFIIFTVPLLTILSSNIFSSLFLKRLLKK